jgi:hypothetical protein
MCELRGCEIRYGTLTDRSFVREGGPDGEPLDLVAGFLDGVFDPFLLSATSFKRDGYHASLRIYADLRDVVQLLYGVLKII